MPLQRSPARSSRCRSGVHVRRPPLDGLQATAVSLCRLRRLFPQGEACPAAGSIGSIRRRNTYPEPTAHCDICRWRIACDGRRRKDDHLSLVAWITKIQINELRQRGVSTVKSLASLPLPLEWKPERGSVQSYDRVREQARLQVEAREAGVAQVRTPAGRSGVRSDSPP